MPFDCDLTKPICWLHCMEKVLQVHLSLVANPLEAWKILHEQFKFVSFTQIVCINHKFYTASMKDDAGSMHT